MKKLVTTTLLLLLFINWGFTQNHSNTPQAFLGVHSNGVSKKKASKLNFPNSNGAYITNVIGNTAAEKNGMQPFDYIYQVGDNEFGSHQGLSSVMQNYQPGDEANVYFVRNGEKMTKSITFGNEADAEYRKRSDEEDPFLGIAQNHNQVPEEVMGISVNIVENSTAEKMGLEDDDIIMEVNDFPIYDWHDVGTAIDMMEVGEEMKVKYMRGNKTTVAYAPIQSLAAMHDRQNQSNDDSDNQNLVQNNDNSNDDNATNEEEVTNSAIAFESTEIMEDMEITMDDMPLEDAEEMKTNLGIDMPVVQNLSIEQLTIFPNPSQGIFNLEFFLPNNAPTTIRIFDGKGKMIYSNDLGNFQGDFNERLDLSRNPAGTYYLMIQQGKLSISKKVVIVRA